MIIIIVPKWYVHPVYVQDLLLFNPGETENEWQKTKQIPNILLRSGRSFFNAKKMKKKFFASLDFGDNPIYPISNPDGQDWEV